CSRVQSVEEIPNGVSSRDTSAPVADRRAINETDARTIPMNSPSTTALVLQLVVARAQFLLHMGELGMILPKSIEIQAGLTEASRYPSIPTEQVELSSNDRS